MGTILKRGNRYQALVRKKGFPTRSKTFHKRLDAVRWSVNVESEMERGEYRPQAKELLRPLSEILDQYLSEISVHKKRATQASDVLSAKKLRKPLGRYVISELSRDPAPIEHYRDDRLKTASPYSVRVELSFLSNVFKYAFAVSGVRDKVNPVAQIKKPRIPEGRIPILTENQILRLLEECGNSTSGLLLPFVVLALHTGCRSMELRKLKWTQIDLSRSLFFLTGDMTKTSRSRTIHLSETCTELLREIRTKYPDHEYVFPAAKDPRKPRDMHRSFDKAVERAGLTDLPNIGKLRIHDLRHICGSYLVMNGLNLEAVREILGHTSLRMTERYLHMAQEYKQRAADIIDNLGKGGRTSD